MSLQTYKPPPIDRERAARAQARLDRLTKPPGSLGRLEALAVRLAGMQAREIPRTEAKALVLMAGDHGVVAEGVTPYPSVVTRQMVANFLSGGAAANVLAQRFGLDLYVADMGINGDTDVPPAPKACWVNHMLDCKVRNGTANFAHEPALSREEAVASVEGGMKIADTVLARGVDLLAVGEMGIGNTTPSTAILCTYLGLAPEHVTGPGTGLDPTGVTKKAAVVKAALGRHRPSPRDPIDVLAKVGGVEIGALAGCMIEAATHRCPVVLDGFITGAAALLAVELQPTVAEYLIASHCSKEPGHRHILSHLGLEPLLALDLRLGEGSGAALAMGLVDASVAILRDMATFSEAGVTDRPAGPVGKGT